MILFGYSKVINLRRWLDLTHAKALIYLLLRISFQSCLLKLSLGLDVDKILARLLLLTVDMLLISITATSKYLGVKSRCPLLARLH